MSGIKTIVAELDELLKPLGFRRQKAMWNRASKPFIDVLDLQTSKAGDRATINVGVFEPDTYVKCWGVDSPTFIEEPYCIARARIGQLTDRMDRWWQLDEPGVWDDIAEQVTKHALPFLSRMHSYEAMTEFLGGLRSVRQRIPPEIIYLAILRFKQGDTVGGCSLLDELQKKGGGWQVRICQVAERLGCSKGKAGDGS